MNLKKALTPKNTEEVKPNLFIQTKQLGEKVEYKVIEPIVWNDKWRLKKQFSLRNLFVIILLLFLWWAYYHDMGEYEKFYREINKDPQGFCKLVYSGDYNYSKINWLEKDGESFNSLPSNT